MAPPRQLLPPRTWKGRLALGLILVGAYFAVAIPVAFFIDLPASGLERANQGLRDLARAELSLRAMGLRRYAEVNGRLPATLAECGSPCPPFHAVMGQGLARQRISQLVEEPWAPRGEGWQLLSAPAETPLPGLDQDVFGLPILFTRGVEKRGAASVTSSEELSPDALAYLDVTDAKLPPPSPEPFTLTSTFLREHAKQIRHQVAVAHLEVACILGSCLLFVAGVVWWIVRARRNAGGSRLAIVFAALGSLATLVFGLGFTMVTCYMPSQRTTSRVRRAERLAYLDRAIARGDVPASVARSARVYIERLPGP